MNTKKRSIFGTLLLLWVLAVACSPETNVVSPGGNHEISLEVNDAGRLLYSIYSHGIPVTEKSVMGIQTMDSAFSFFSGLRLVEKEERIIDEAYSLPTGKTRIYKNRANETVFTFQNKHDHKMEVICRAYDDGIAFRYTIKKQGLKITEEKTSFYLPDASTSWMMDYSPAYEDYYAKGPVNTFKKNSSISFPALLQMKGDNWLLLTEASVRDHPATHLVKKEGTQWGIQFPEKTFSVKNFYRSPWRVFITGSLKDIVESVMVENLNPPASLKNQDWINPGVAVFPWWGDFMANSSMEKLKEYVDLAAEMNWEWIEFDVALVGSPFHTDTLWKSADWIPDFTNYAKSKGIKVYGWDEFKVLQTPHQRDSLFSTYKSLGIDGIKIDFLNSDKQEMMLFREAALQDAARHKLHVSFHGATIPRGHRRTYPHLMTREAVKGAEYYAPIGQTSPPTPEHNCTLPFTRNVIGPMDYTPVTFTIREGNPRKTTYAHELALAVIFESGWQVMADRPGAYLNSPAKAILKEIEATWDETHFIDGFPGDFVVLARRNGKKWFIAGINSGKEREIIVPLDFAGKQTDSVMIYEDHPENPLHDIQIRSAPLEKGVLSASMQTNGGFCALITEN